MRTSNPPITRRSFLAGAGSLAASSSLGAIRGRSVLSRDGRDAIAVAVTTSIADTGVLSPLHAAFETTHDETVNAVIGGTGRNLRSGERGDVSVVMAHAPELERAFVSAGHGVARERFVEGSFSIVGPPDDPAGIKGADQVSAAFAAIADAESPFVSRGDGSGTHHAERACWAATGIDPAAVDPAGQWYREIGQGMGETLVHADQLEAYCLSVRETYRASRNTRSLVELLSIEDVRDGTLLQNPYSLIRVSPDRHPQLEHDRARAYIDFCTGPEGRSIIDSFSVDGRSVFSLAE